MAQKNLLRCCSLAVLLLSQLVQSRSAFRLRRRETVVLKGSGPCPSASRHPNRPEQGREKKRGLCKEPEPRGVLRVRAIRGCADALVPSLGLSSAQQLPRTLKCIK